MVRIIKSGKKYYRKIQNVKINDRQNYLSSSGKNKNYFICLLKECLTLIKKENKCRECIYLISFCTKNF